VAYFLCGRKPNTATTKMHLTPSTKELGGPGYLPFSQGGSNQTFTLHRGMRRLAQSTVNEQNVSASNFQHLLATRPSRNNPYVHEPSLSVSAFGLCFDLMGSMTCLDRFAPRKDSTGLRQNVSQKKHYCPLDTRNTLVFGGCTDPSRPTMSCVNGRADCSCCHRSG
jgi:hypothetical protein